MHDLAVVVRVEKTGSSSLYQLLIAAAAASHGGDADWLCWPNRLGMSHAAPCPAHAEVAIGAAPVYGSGDVARDASVWRRGLRMLTTLREPVARVASEHAYFCLECAEKNRFCGRSSPFCSDKNRTNFTDWALRAPNHVVQKFARSWPSQSFLREFVDGFSTAVSMRVVDRATQVLTRNTSLVLYVDDPDQAAQLARLRAWLDDGVPGGRSRAARALASVRAFPHENALPKEAQYVPTAAERAIACNANWADCLIWERLGRGRCAC